MSSSWDPSKLECKVFTSDLAALIEIVLADRALASWWRFNAGKDLVPAELAELRKINVRKQRAWEAVNDALVDRVIKRIERAA